MAWIKALFGNVVSALKDLVKLGKYENSFALAGINETANDFLVVHNDTTEHGSNAVDLSAYSTLHIDASAYSTGATTWKCGSLTYNLAHDSVRRTFTFDVSLLSSAIISVQNSNNEGYCVIHNIWLD